MDLVECMCAKKKLQYPWITINLILYFQLPSIYQLYEHFHLVSATDAYMSTNA